MSYRLICAGVALGVCSVAAAQPDAPAPVDYWLKAAAAEAAQLSNPAEKAGVLTSVAVQWEMAGNTAAANAAAGDAAQAAAQIQDPEARFRAEMALAGFADQYQDTAAAQRAVAAAQAEVPRLPAGVARDSAANELANLHHVLDGLHTATVQINADPDATRRAQELAALAIAFAQAGPRHHDDYAAAVAAVSGNLKLVIDAAANGDIQAMLVQAQVAAGDMEPAAATARNIVAPASAADAYSVLADAYIKNGQNPQAADAIAHMTTAAQTAPDDRRSAIYLNIARARDALNDKPGALAAIDQAVRASGRLESADRADALAGAARLRAQLGDNPGAAVLAGDAAAAARTVTDPADQAEVWMSVAAAQARCGLGQLARESISLAVAAAPNIPPDKRHPEGDPPPPAYLDVIHAAAENGDFAAAQAIAASVNNPHLMHDAVMAIAGEQINLGQYQAAEDLVQKEGTIDAEAAVCGMIAASLTRTRSPADAGHWIERLHNPSDKIAARLAVAEVQESKR